MVTNVVGFEAWHTVLAMLRHFFNDITNCTSVNRNFRFFLKQIIIFKKFNSALYFSEDQTPSNMSDKLSYICTPITTPYVYQAIPDRLRYLATETPDLDAFIFYDKDGKRQAVSRKEIYETSLSLAKHFAQLGIQKGSVVGVCMNNSISMLYVIFGIICSGGIPFFLATNLKDGSDIIDMMNDMKSEYLIIDVTKDDENLQFLVNVWPSDSKRSTKIPSLKKILFNGILFPDSGSSISLTELIENPPPDDIALPQVYPEDTMACFCTSGSTGKSKAVMLSHYAMLNCTLLHTADTGISSGTVYFCDRQLGWVVGFPRTYVANGCTRVFVDTRMSLSGHHVEWLCDIIEKERATSVYIPSYLATDLLRNEQCAPKFKNVRVMTFSGERLKATFVQLKDKFCKKLVSWYGNTEGGSIATFYSEENAGYEDGIIGRPLPGLEVKIIDNQDQVVPLGETGELCVRSTWKFTGYKGMPELSQEVVDSLGWFHTGDIAHIRRDGNIVVDGRIKELISMQTVKYFPWEIENILMKCSGVKYAIAVGVPDVRLTQVVCACVVPEEGVAFTEEHVKKFCDDTFLDESTSAGLSLKPKYHIVLNELPLSSAGKIDRRRIGIIAKERLGL